MLTTKKYKSAIKHIKFNPCEHYNIETVGEEFFAKPNAFIVDKAGAAIHVTGMSSPIYCPFCGRRAR